MKNKLILCTTLVVLISLFKVSAQGVTDVKTYGGSKSDYAYRLVNDAVGNHYVVGFFASPTMQIGAFTLTNAGDTNAFIAKFDKNWNVLWASSIQGNTVDYGLNCVADNLGNCYMVGCYYSSSIQVGTFNLTNANFGVTSDIFVTKYDPAGTVLWAKRAGGNGTDKAIGIDINGMSTEVIVTGWFYSPSISFDTYNLTNSGPGTADIFISKYSSSGNVIWAKKVTGVQNDEATAISLDDAGNFFLTGWFSSDTLKFGNVVVKNSGGYFPRRDAFIARYNASGVEQWAKVGGGSKQDGGSCVIASKDGQRVYFGGSYNSDSFKMGSMSVANSGGYDFFVAALDNTGQQLWLQKGGGKGNDNCNGINFRSNTVAVIGTFNSSNFVLGVDTLKNRSTIDSFGILYSDAFIARYDIDGEIMWANSQGGKKDDAGTSTVFENGYRLNISGVFTDTLQYGTGGTKYPGKGALDFFVAEYGFNDLKGTITFNATPVSKGKVVLRLVNPGQSAPVAGAASIKSNGSFTISDVPPGSYYLYAEPDAIAYPQLIKTYYMSTPYWSGANAISVLPTDTVLGNLNISMIEMVSVPPGNGEITGKIISLDGTRAAGSPIKDVEVTVMKIPPGKVVKKDFSDADGNYNISGLSDGNYQVMIDISGLKLDSAYLLSIGAEQLTYKNRNYAVDVNGIHIDTSSSSIKFQIRSLHNLYVYPNPAHDQVILKFDNYNPEFFDLKMFDITGKEVLHLPDMVMDQNRLIMLDLKNCPAGVYMLRAASTLNVYAGRIIINK
jgi:hypothetical protein